MTNRYPYVFVLSITLAIGCGSGSVDPEDWGEAASGSGGASTGAGGGVGGTTAVVGGIAVNGTHLRQFETGGANAIGATPAAGGAPIAGASGAATRSIVTSGTGGSKTTGRKLATGGTPTTGVSGPETGSIVPLYSDPDDPAWSAIVAAKLDHPSVSVIAILNPQNGPGSAASDSYSSGIASLTAAGIGTIGYVYTDYGARSSATVRTEIARWHDWYPALSGIFFDEQSNDPADVSYYRDLSAYVKSLGMTMTVGNPGTDTGDVYIGAVDVSLIYESADLPSGGMLATWQSRYPRQSVGIIPYASEPDIAWVRSARTAVGYIYVTNDDEPNPWDTLPSFYANLLGALE